MIGYEVGEYGSCSGDSGGPIVKYVQEKGRSQAHYIQVGMVTGGFGGCGNGALPAIYTRLEDNAILSFVQQTITGDKLFLQQTLSLL